MGEIKYWFSSWKRSKKKHEHWTVSKSLDLRLRLESQVQSTLLRNQNQCTAFSEEDNNKCSWMIIRNTKTMNTNPKECWFEYFCRWRHFAFALKSQGLFLFLCVPPKHDHKKEKVTKSVIFFIYVSDASCGADDADGTVFKRLSLAPRWFSIILKFNLEGFKWI